MISTPTDGARLDRRLATFDSLAEGLDYVARGDASLNFYSGRGELSAAVTYTELREQAIGVARGLVQAGLPKGARMVILAETDRDFITVFLACQYAGVVPVPVAIPTTIGGRDAYIAGLRRQLEGCGAAAAMGPAELVPYLEAAAEGLDVSLVGGPAAFRDLPGARADLRPLGKGDPCYLQFSSGSTRRPQGIDIPQASLMANCHSIARHGLRVAEGDRCVSWLPLYHDMGLVGFFLTPLLTQMSVDYMLTRDFARRPLMWLSIITRNGGTLSYSPSFGYDLCVRRASESAVSALDLRGWRVAGLGGDMIQPHVLRQFAESFAGAGFSPGAFTPSYGLAEATLAVSFGVLGDGLRIDRVRRHRLAEAGEAEPAANGHDTDAREFMVCGHTLPDHVLEIRDPDGAPLPDRRVGRIFVKGPSLMAGYFGQPEATGAVLSSDGWLDITPDDDAATPE
ncbi:MAG: AMP-binding protein, partial [Kiloniellaceae bacterium]